MKFDLPAARAAIDRSDLVSFDVFDTALLRLVERPTDVFRLIAAEAAQDREGGFPDFVRHRRRAERSAQRIAARECRQVTLTDIYEELGRTCALDAGQIRSWAEREITTQAKCVYAHPLILELFRYAISVEKSAVFLSDMYLPSTCLTEILTAAGYAPTPIFVSAEHGGNKASGRLFRIVAERLGIAPERCLHFGDNAYADVWRARRAGWKAIHTLSANPRVAAEVIPASATSLADSTAIGLGRRHAAALGGSSSPATDSESFWESFGYETVGPVYFAFLHWLCRQSQRDGVDHLLLSARDGFPLQRGLEIVCAAWNLPLRWTYFYASRQLMGFAAIDVLTSAALDFLLMPTPGLSLRDFVIRLGFDATAHEPALRALGFDSIDVPITHPFFGRFLRPADRERLVRWLQGNREELLASFAEQRRVLLPYLRQIGIEQPATAVVDLGWKAQVARDVQKLLTPHHPNIRLHAYLFGTTVAAKAFESQGGRLASFFMHLGRPTRRRRLLAGNEGLVELLFAAPHGSILNLRQEGDLYLPVTAPCEYGMDQLALLERMQAGAFRFIADAAARVSVSNPPGADYAERCLRQLLQHPTLEQARHLGGMPYRVGFSFAGRARPFASLPCAKSFTATLQAVGASPWRAGFLAQVKSAWRGPLRVALAGSGARAALRSGSMWRSMRWALLGR